VGSTESGDGEAALKFILEDVFNDGLKAAVTITVRCFVVSGLTVTLPSTFGFGASFFFGLRCAKAAAETDSKMNIMSNFFMPVCFTVALLYCFYSFPLQLYPVCPAPPFSGRGRQRFV
jgi:hypothetical protein